MQRPPTGKLNVNKTKNNIYDAVRKVDEEKEQVGSVHKPTLTFKKNKLLKPDMMGNNGPDTRGRSRQGQEQLEQSTDNATNITKQTPLFNRNKGRMLAGKSKEKPVIQEQQDEIPTSAKQNRMAYVNDEQPTQSQQIELPLQQEPSKKLIKPNLFKGIGDKKRPLIPSSSHTKQPQQHHDKLLNNSQVYQEYNTSQQKKEKFNFQKMMNVQRQQINLQPTLQSQITGDKLAKQLKRAKDLSQLLNLQPDTYQPIMSVTSTTPFQVYISKIKSGFLKNSCDQAFDQRNDVQCQTLSYQYIDFSNQCPQDYQLGSGTFHTMEHHEPSHSIDELILTLAPVIQELIKPSRNVVMPPTSLLAFSPAFKKFLKCPNPTFVYYSEQYNYSLVAIGEKLYICEDQIQCALDLGGMKLAGLKNGRVVVWNGENDRSSVVYVQVKELIQSQNFQLPVYVTNDFDKLSPYLCTGAIVALVAGDAKNTFYTLDSSAKMVKWQIEKQNKKTVLIPTELQQFSKLIEKRHIVGLGMKRRNSIFYLHTSSGIICYDSHIVHQRLQTYNIKDFHLPKRSSLVYCLTQFSTVIIFDESCHLLMSEITLQLDDDDTVQELIVPELEHDNREISLFYHCFVVTEKGNVYEVKMGETEEVRKLQGGKGGKEEGDDEPGLRSKRASSIIYQGVNLLGNKIQKIKLYKDLKCTTELSQLTVDLTPTVNNLKSIILKNKQFLSQIMDNNMCLV